MNLVKYWNPAPIITHLVDEEAGDRTLCGKLVAAGWESGEDGIDPSLENTVACIACGRSARRVAALAARDGAK